MCGISSENRGKSIEPTQTHIQSCTSADPSTHTHTHTHTHTCTSAMRTEKSIKFEQENSKGRQVQKSDSEVPGMITANEGETRTENTISAEIEIIISQEMCTILKNI